MSSTNIASKLSFGTSRSPQKPNALGKPRDQSFTGSQSIETSSNIPQMPPTQSYGTQPYDYDYSSTTGPLSNCTFKNQPEIKYECPYAMQTGFYPSHTEETKPEVSFYTPFNSKSIISAMGNVEKPPTSYMENKENYSTSNFRPVIYPETKEKNAWQSDANNFSSPKGVYEFNAASLLESGRKGPTSYNVLSPKKEAVYDFRWKEPVKFDNFSKKQEPEYFYNNIKSDLPSDFPPQNPVQAEFSENFQPSSTSPIKRTEKVHVTLDSKTTRTEMVWEEGPWKQKKVTETIHYSNQEGLDSPSEIKMTPRNPRPHYDYPCTSVMTKDINSLHTNQKEQFGTSCRKEKQLQSVSIDLTAEKGKENEFMKAISAVKNEKMMASGKKQEMFLIDSISKIKEKAEQMVKEEGCFSKREGFGVKKSPRFEGEDFAKKIGELNAMLNSNLANNIQEAKKNQERDLIYQKATEVVPVLNFPKELRNAPKEIEKKEECPIIQKKEDEVKIEEEDFEENFIFTTTEGLTYYKIKPPSDYISNKTDSPGQPIPQSPKVEAVSKSEENSADCVRKPPEPEKSSPKNKVSAFTQVSPRVPSPTIKNEPKKPEKKDQEVMVEREKAVCETSTQVQDFLTSNQKNLKEPVENQETERKGKEAGPQNSFFTRKGSLSKPVTKTHLRGPSPSIKTIQNQVPKQKTAALAPRESQKMTQAPPQKNAWKSRQASRDLSRNSKKAEVPSEPQKNQVIPCPKNDKTDHCKRKRQSSEEMTRKINERAQILEQKRQKLATELSQKELKECTFKPIVSSTKSESGQRSFKEFLDSQESHKRKVESKIRVGVYEKDTKEKKEMTFKPKINKERGNQSMCLPGDTSMTSLSVHDRLYSTKNKKEDTLGGRRKSESKAMLNVSVLSHNEPKRNSSLSQKVKARNQSKEASSKMTSEASFKPSINKKSQMLKRNGKVEDLLRNKGKEMEARKQLALNRKEKSDNEARNKFMSAKSQQMLVRRFEREVECAYLNAGITIDDCLNFMQMVEIMRRLGFISTIEGLELPHFEVERTLLIDMWTILKGDELEGISFHNFLVFTLAILGLHVQEKGLERENLSETANHPRQSDSGLAIIGENPLKNGDSFSSSQINTIEENINITSQDSGEASNEILRVEGKPGTPEVFNGCSGINGENTSRFNVPEETEPAEDALVPIGGFNSESLLSLSVEEVRLIHTAYEYFYVNRLNDEEFVNIKTVHDFQEPSFFPKILESSKALALQHREKLLEEAATLMEHNLVEVPPDGKLTHTDLLVIRKKAEDIMKERMREERELEQMNECSFKPDLNMTQSTIRCLSQSGISKGEELFARAKPKRQDRDKRDLEYEQQIEECTFTPNAFDTRRGSDMSYMSSKDVTVRDADKSIARMRRARPASKEANERQHSMSFANERSKFKSSFDLGPKETLKVREMPPKKPTYLPPRQQFRRKTSEKNTNQFFNQMSLCSEIRAEEEYREEPSRSMISQNCYDPTNQSLSGIEKERSNFSEAEDGTVRSGDILAKEKDPSTSENQHWEPMHQKTEAESQVLRRDTHQLDSFSTQQMIEDVSAIQNTQNHDGEYFNVMRTAPDAEWTREKLLGSENEEEFGLGENNEGHYHQIQANVNQSEMAEDKDGNSMEQMEARMALENQERQGFERGFGEGDFKDLSSNEEFRDISPIRSSAEGLPRGKEEDHMCEEDEHEEDERVPLLFVDVNLGQGKSERIVVFEGDTAEALSEKFAVEHSLDEAMTIKLRQMLEIQIAGILTRIEEEDSSFSDED